MRFGGVRAAFAFLTRIPVGSGPIGPEDLLWSSAFFPLVGLALGVTLAALHMTLGLVLGPWGAALLTVGASLLLTGAFHEDGLADTFDAIGGGYTRERVLEILKDSRIGTYGASALSLSLVARVVCVATLGSAAPPAFVVIECLSRAPPVVVLAVLPYATRPPEAKSKDVAAGGVPQAVWALATALGMLVGACVVGVLEGVSAVGLLLLGGAVAALSASRFARTVGGVTGDFLGAIQQLVAVALWLAWAAP